MPASDDSQWTIGDAVEAFELPPPPGLRASTVQLGDDSYLVLSFPTPTWNLPSRLSDAEREVARGLLQGASNESIALERGTSARTVANQIATIFAKLGVRSRMELACAIGSGNAQAQADWPRSRSARTSRDDRNR